MRTKSYYGTFWIVFEGKNPRIYDKKLSFKFENLWITKEEFNLFSFSFYDRFEIIILSFSLKFYY
jgi:hypothetical protein